MGIENFSGSVEKMRPVDKPEKIEGWVDKIREAELRVKEMFDRNMEARSTLTSFSDQKERNFG